MTCAGARATVGSTRWLRGVRRGYDGRGRLGPAWVARTHLRRRETVFDGGFEMVPRLCVFVSLLCGVIHDSSGVRTELECGDELADVLAVVATVTRLRHDPGAVQLRVSQSDAIGEEIWTDRILTVTGVGSRDCDGRLQVGDRRVFYLHGDERLWRMSGFSAVQSEQDASGLQKGMFFGIFQQADTGRPVFGRVISGYTLMDAQQ